MARRGKARSLLTKRIASVVKIKPRLPRVKGPFTRVRFFGLTRDATVECLGDLVLKDGRIVAEPPDSLALRKMLAEPLRDDRGSRPVWIDPVREPEKFLATLPKVLGHGSYFWAEAVGMKNDTRGD